MRFKGQLLIPAEGGPGLSVDLEVEGRQLSVVSEAETLGVWPLDSVRVRRLAGDKFAMEVAGEDLHFVADDTISFAYDGISAIEQRRAPLRGRKAVLNGLKGIFGREDIDPLASPTSSDTVTDSADADSILMGSDQENLDLTEETTDWETETTDRDGGDGRPDDPIIPVRGLPGLRSTEPEAAPQSRQTAIPSPIPQAAEANVCRALRNDGLPCESPIVGDSGFCYPHDTSNPVGKTFSDAQEARARLREKRARKLGRVYSRLDKALSQVESGEMDTDQAMAMAQLARTMCAILELDDGNDGDDTAGPSASPSHPPR